MTNISANALNIIKTLQNKGFPAYLVGGSVRDNLLDLPVEEWDITTAATPQEVSRLFTKIVPTGIEYGTVTILLDGEAYEVTTFRADEKYIDGRHPSNVVFTEDIHLDLSRRDFTINALAYDPLNDQLIDDFNGQQDLKAKLIRAVGNPLERLSEDGLRSIRACRFAAKLNFVIEPATLAAVSQTLAVTKTVAPERVRDELVKMLASAQPSIGLDLMRQTGLLQLIIPELVACIDVKQPAEFHKYDVYWHNLYACDAADKAKRIVRLAALFHDISKPACQVDMTFYNHDQVGANVAEQILKRLRFGNQEIAQVSNLVRQHMFHYTSDWTDSAVRRFIKRIGGVANVADLFALRLADTKAMEREIESDYLKELRKRIDKIIDEENALDVKDLKINGTDVMEQLQIPPGKKVGAVLNALLEKVLDQPELNDRETLLKLITPSS